MLLLLLLTGVFGTVQQMPMFRMITQFKQHFVPFVLISGKAIISGLTILFSAHSANSFQLFGLFLVVTFAIYEFISELIEEKKKDTLNQ